MLEDLSTIMERIIERKLTLPQKSANLSNSNWVWHNPGGPKLGGNPVCHMPVFSSHVPSDRVVSGKGARAVWAGYTDSLMPLANMSS